MWAGDEVGWQGLCASGCVGFDRLVSRYSVTLPRGADGGAVRLVGAVDGVTVTVTVDDARGGGIVAGKSILVGMEVGTGGHGRLGGGGFGGGSP